MLDGKGGYYRFKEDDYNFVKVIESDKKYPLPLEKMYGYDPASGMNAESSSRVLGLQGNLWTEFIGEEWHLEYMLLPRLLAISECGWTLPENKDYTRFREDVVNCHFQWMAAHGYNYSRTILESDRRVLPWAMNAHF